jgi:hypothetical protein
VEEVFSIEIVTLPYMLEMHLISHLKFSHKHVTLKFALQSIQNGVTGMNVQLLVVGVFSTETEMSQSIHQETPLIQLFKENRKFVTHSHVLQNTQNGQSGHLVLRLVEEVLNSDTVI